MKIIQTHRSLLITGFLICVFLPLVPASASAQDEKGPVASRYGNMATTAELLRLMRHLERDRVLRLGGYLVAPPQHEHLRRQGQAHQRHDSHVQRGADILEQDDQPGPLLPGGDPGVIQGGPGQRRREHRQRHDDVVPGGNRLVGGGGDIR